MTTIAALAYLLIICYFVIERLLRQGEQALSLQVGESDQGSSKVLWISGLLNILLVLFAPILNAYQFGYWHSQFFSWVGLLLMLGGLFGRYWAAKTLGKFYTRTLQTSEGQQLIEQAPYNVVRNPGYLGTLLMILGAGLAVENWAVLAIVAVIGAFSRLYRIHAEEEILKTTFGKKYTVYSTNTWRLIPFIY